MTDPRTAFLQDLLERIEALETIPVDELRAELTLARETHERTMASMAELTEKVAQLAKQKAVQDWREVTPWAARATTEHWDGLVHWVDWLRSSYELKIAIPPCWPAHAGVVEELAALWQGWLAARMAVGQGEGDAVMYWADRGLHPTIAHFKLLQFESCAGDNSHRTPITRNPKPTDRSLQPAPYNPEDSDSI